MSTGKTATAISQEYEAMLRRQRLPWAEFSLERTVDPDKEIDRASEFYRSDPRTRALVDGSVARACEMTGPIDPDRADRDAANLATWAAVFVLAQVYVRDSEIAAMRAERDHFRKLAEDALMRIPASYVARAT